MKILALPRDPNPYQERLYSEVRRLGGSVRYLGTLTPSHSLNVLLLPLETCVRAAMGWRVVHVHWVFCFMLPGSRRFAGVRRLSQLWFMLWLRCARALGMTIVWTAHNALPHEPVFANDLAARRALVDASGVVIAHSEATLQELAGLGIVPRAVAVVPHGPMQVRRGPCRGPTPAHTGARRLLYFGNVRDYKGVDDLLVAAAGIPADVGFTLDVVGECPEPILRQRLEQLAAAAGERVRLDLRFIPEPELESLLNEADVVVLPFRRITTSGSVHLVIAHERPLIVPALPAFDELPDAAVMRYDGSITGLAKAIENLAQASPDVLEAMSAAWRDSDVPDWDEIAALTMRAIVAARRSS